MANLIITVIAIALVAIASLMGAYYGGSAFLNNQSAANASTVLNQAQQIAGAWNAYLSDNMNSAPTNVQQLVTAGYLAQIPTAPAESGSAGPYGIWIGQAAMADGSTHYFAYADMGEEAGGIRGALGSSASAACARIIKTAIGAANFNADASMAVPQNPSGQIASTATMGNGTFGCGWDDSDGAHNHPLAGSNMPDLTQHYVFEYLLQ